jgi:hypothetical protein
VIISAALDEPEIAEAHRYTEANPLLKILR